MNRNLVRWLCAIGLLGFTASACAPQYCTLIGCVPTVVVTVHPPQGGTIADGMYVIQVDGEESRTCTVSNGQIDCANDGLPRNSTLTPSDGLRVTWMQQSRSLPTILHVTVDKDGTRVIDTMTTPSTSLSYPNGYACDKDDPCQAAVGDVSL